MSINPETAQEDLAFMKALVSDSESDNRGMVLYMAAGLIYGLQCIVTYLMHTSFTVTSATPWILANTLPTVVFLIITFAYVRKQESPAMGTGASKRALSGAFAGAGIAAGVLALVFTMVASAQGNSSIQLLLPIVICALQGAVWFAVMVVRRKTLYGLTAAGWFVVTVPLALNLSNPPMYLLTLGAAMIVLMALPGYLVSRPNSAAA